MKKLILIMSLLFFSVCYSAGVVNNSGVTSSDKISIPFYLLDNTTGDLVTMVSGDKVSLCVWYPSGDNGSGSPAYHDSLAFDHTDIDAELIMGGKYIYNLTRTVSVIDGTAENGIYSYALVANDESTGDQTVFTGTFQLYTSADYDDVLDEITNQDWATGTEVSTLATSAEVSTHHELLKNLLTLKAGSTATIGRIAAYDSICVYNSSAELILKQYYYHVAGEAGDNPDSVKGIAP